jgi:hypothetical protein
MQTLARAAVLGIVMVAASCDKAPELVAPSGTFVGGPVRVETFSGTLAPTGFRFFSFTVPTAGTIYLTLMSLSVNDAPLDANMRLTIGVPAGIDCASEFTTVAPPRPSPQLSGFVAPGVYCARIADAAALTEPAQFHLNIAYPR